MAVEQWPLTDNLSLPHIFACHTDADLIYMLRWLLKQICEKNSTNGSWMYFTARQDIVDNKRFLPVSWTGATAMIPIERLRDDKVEGLYFTPI